MTLLRATSKETLLACLDAQRAQSATLKSAESSLTFARDSSRNGASHLIAD